MTAETIATNRAKRRPDTLALVSVAVLTIIVGAALAAPLLTPFGPNDIDLSNLETVPNGTHLLGTDELGRDVFSRLLYGGRVSVLVGLAAVVVQLVIGITLGSLAGYWGGAVDGAVMRITEMVMCFPFYAIAICLAALLGASVWNVILIIGVLGWTGLARLVRAEMMSVRKREFVQAANILGVRHLTIVTRHLLPNVIGPILVYATLAVANGILAEAALSFLGLGVKLPEPSWGNMLSAAQSMRVLGTEPWLWIPPGVCIVLMVLAINGIGESLRAHLDPRSHATLNDLRPRRFRFKRQPIDSRSTAEITTTKESTNAKPH
ncbi:oligopeptide ABC transporter permease [Lysinibacter cavernae]|uniref:Peptide/nickel transport system permease protein n=1 Tax=Lysinibacter cavernae TaxID=1640652 RepID=A0A7X5TSM2_9MICO|nr:oligopeptide ABC transporter permease [Lysinibacter cavernae]NIH52584.1 peptide/nickel transport system permease protein [Lysinibacter cavernae]